MSQQTERSPPTTRRNLLGLATPVTQRPSQQNKQNQGHRDQNQQPIRGGAVLFDALYALKERSMYSTTDNGVTEPDGWSCPMRYYLRTTQNHVLHKLRNAIITTPLITVRYVVKRQLGMESS